MGLAMRGITHCEKCGNPLKLGEYYKCERCLMQEIDKQEKLKLDKLTIVRMGKIEEYKGFWAKGKFIVIQ